MIALTPTVIGRSGVELCLASTKLCQVPNRHEKFAVVTTVGKAQAAKRHDFTDRCDLELYVT